MRNLYPPDTETQEDIEQIRAAQNTLRRYHRRFYCFLTERRKQLSGKVFLYNDRLEIAIILAPM